MRRFFKFWAPLLLWMALIFCASTQAGSPSVSSHLLRIFLRWLGLGISDESFDLIHTCVRKAGHLTEYAGLGYLALRTLRAELPSTQNRPAVAAASAILFCALYASTDEFHQSFVPTRHPAVTDVMIDTAGAAAGVTLTFAIEKFRRAK